MKRIVLMTLALSLIVVAPAAGFSEAASDSTKAVKPKPPKPMAQAPT